MQIMLKFYYSGAPNPTKIALFLEEAGLPYDPIPVDTRKGDQHKPEFLAINPNAKVPAIVDGDAVVFDSSAILLYLAEKTGKFLPAKTDKARGELLSWMFFVSSGVGPYFGQSVHFRNYAPEKLPSTATPSRRAAMPAFSMRGSASTNTCWATPTPSST
jgi:GSH-dependent disulfide-bond oxidoreductase